MTRPAGSYSAGAAGVPNWTVGIVVCHAIVWFAMSPAYTIPPSDVNTMVEPSSVMDGLLDTEEPAESCQYASMVGPRGEEVGAADETVYRKEKRTEKEERASRGRSAMRLGALGKNSTPKSDLQKGPPPYCQFCHFAVVLLWLLLTLVSFPGISCFHSARQPHQAAPPPDSRKQRPLQPLLRKMHFLVNVYRDIGACGLESTAI